MDIYRGIVIFGETADGKLASITREMLGAGRRLADNFGEEVHVILVGRGIQSAVDETFTYGADKVHLLDNPKVKEYQPDLFVQCAIQVCEKAKPKAFLLGHTDMGQDLGPRIAFRLNTALVTDCIDLTIDLDTKRCIMAKQVYGGKAQADFDCETYPQMATIRPKTMSPLEKDETRKGEIIPITIDIDDSIIKTRLIDKVNEESHGIKLEDADIIISGGRGIGGPEGFQQLEDLAGLFKNAAVGASRPACDEEWVSTKIQVGITGKIVAPRVYIAVGISGASQHVTGCSGSETIIAINKDKTAPIFKVSKFGLVADWETALPAFANKVKELIND
ncbi:MAG: electron transfer flavoprotein subunit alpha/FixB family protein [Deltaproteobacteria bacterium]|nr:electron transfer flavoprotein subunit alpha/FixB family protein [Deltaproteobacteria bacterium]